MNKFQTRMALTRVKKTTVSTVVTEVVNEVVAEVSEKQKLKLLRRAAFLKHKESGGGDYTRVKASHRRSHYDE